MKPYQIIYSRSRFPKQQKRKDGTWGCRGCGGVIPKGRQTWCSKDCCNTFHPAFVISNVRKRDKDVCSVCGYNCHAEYHRWMNNHPNSKHKTENLTWDEWRKRKPHQAQYDHTTPFSEGGMTVLENMRTLCEPCHKKRTKDWHRDRRLSLSEDENTATLFTQTELLA